MSKPAPQPEPLLLCYTCRAMLPEIAFQPNKEKRYRNYRAGDCRECKSAYDKARRENMRSEK